jgi:hypothetical protein
MKLNVRKLEKHIPLVLAFLFLATGDYAALVRNIQLLL